MQRKWGKQRDTGGSGKGTRSLPPPPPVHFHFFRASFYLAPLLTFWRPRAYRMRKPIPPEINDGSRAMVNTLNFRFLENPDPMMRSVWIFEEKACEKGFSSLAKNAHKFAEQLGTSLTLATFDPLCSTQQAPKKRISRYQVRQMILGKM